MILALLIATAFTFVVFDALTWHKMDLHIIFAKSCVIGLIFIIFALSGDYAFDMAVMSAIAVIGLNFLLTLLTNFVLYLLHRYNLCNYKALFGCFGVSYIVLIFCIVQLNSIFNGS